MNFYNLNTIMDNVNVHNKYLLTSVVARRALQISEMKGSKAGLGSGDPDEKAISMALADMEAGNVQVQLQHETVADAIENELENETETKTPDVDFDSQENTVAQPSQK
jgi:DNA-directed RNA polymerase subunit K/omega